MLRYTPSPYTEKKKMKHVILAATLMLAQLTVAATAGVTVLDGDTLNVNGQSVRLNGIDAPETGQLCKKKDGGNWACGKVATKHLQKLVRGNRVSCEHREFDQYGRSIGVCYANGVELNAAMIEAGLAWSFRRYSSDYNRLESQVKKTGRGIWQAKTMPAWEFRAQKWKAASQKASGRCNIKGNINRKGQRIYHMPWQRYYGRTRINTAKGERWFCDENEARAAGWRKSRR
ncbi:MAG: thermonuclease family protein [Roseibium album]|uniref:thermonuclease family protein n=1 Tax=Roseibium album TaxID=311410 RepID=UPI0032ED0313